MAKGSDQSKRVRITRSPAPGRQKSNARDPEWEQRNGKARASRFPSSESGAAASLPELRPPPAVMKTRCSQTIEGEVRPGGKNRLHSNPLFTTAVPSKAECLSDLRLFQLVRDGTYDEVLKELEAAAPHDAETAWNKTKLLRMVQRQRQKSYGSIRNAVTSKRKDLTPDVNASTTQNLDTQLPSLERPSNDMMVTRMLHELAVLHDLQPRTVAEHEAKATHEQIYVPVQVYIEKEVSKSRTSSPLLGRASSPLVGELTQSLSSEFSSHSLAASQLSSPSNSLAELSRGSTSGTQKSGGSGRQSAPPFVNRKNWIFQPGLPANDGSLRDLRMNSPVGDRNNRSDYFSRISYASLPFPESHGFWGIAWKHPQDIFRTKPGIDTQGIKTINSKSFADVSAHMEKLSDSLRMSLYGSSSLSKAAQRTMWPEEAPKMSSVRQARESAQKEAVEFLDMHRALRRKSMEAEVGEIYTHTASSGDNLDKMQRMGLDKAVELWESSLDGLPDVDGVEQSRIDEAMQLVLKVEKLTKKKEDKLKGMIHEIWKCDVVGTALQREEEATKYMYSTIYSVEEHAAKLAAANLERAQKKIVVAEHAVERAEQEIGIHIGRLENEQVCSAASAENLVTVTTQRDKLSREVAEQHEFVIEQQRVITTLKAQIMNFESQAYAASQSGKADTVDEFKGKAENARLRTNDMRASLETAMEKLALKRGELEDLELQVRQSKNLAQKDQTRLEEIQKVVAKGRARLQELENRLAEERSEVEELALRAQHRDEIEQTARVKAQIQDPQKLSPMAVIDRLRASSLALVANIMLASEDPDISTDEQEPVYLGERLDGKRHGFGLLQFAAGAEYLGQFEDDLPCGIGMERYADGSAFHGSFRNGERHGMGVYTLATKVAYLGLFSGGRRAGPGVICIDDPSPGMPYWPAVVCVCRADSQQAMSAGKFRTDCVQHALLITDVLVAQRLALDMAKRARALGLTDFFTKQEHAQMDSRHFMGLTVLPRAPSIKAFQLSGSFDEIKSVVAVKMKDLDAVSRLAATPGGRKAAKRARDRLRLPFERGEGRRHATSIYRTAPAVSAYYKP